MGAQRGIAVARLAPLLLVGGADDRLCIVAARQLAAAAERGGPPVNIELLGFAGCPNTPHMRRNLRAALAAIGDERLTVVEVDQAALPEDDLRRGYPTPTVLVNGEDLYGLPPSPAMTCRMYPGGVPTADDLARQIRMKTEQ